MSIPLLDPRKYRPSPLNTKLVPEEKKEKGKREFGSSVDEIPEGYAKANIAIIALLDENYKAIQRLNNLTELQRPKGLTYPMTITLTPSTQLVRIDFENGDVGSNSTRNLPVGSNVYYPFTKLYSLKITNDGPASVFFSTNSTVSQTEAQYKLNANESWEDNRLFPTYFSINVVLEGGSVSNSTVRIIGLAYFF